MSMQSSEPRVRVFPTGRKDVEIVAYDERLHSQFTDILRQPRWRHAKPLVTVVSNRTSRPVRAIVVRWSYVDPSGRPINTGGQRTLTDTQENLFNNGLNIVEASSETLIAPGGHQQTASLPLGMKRILGGEPSLTLTGPMMASSYVDVEFDLAVLADGELIGPDRSQITAQLQDLTSVTAQLASAVKAANLQGKDRATLVGDLKQIISEGIRSDPYALILNQLVESPRATTSEFWNQYGDAPLAFYRR